MESSINIIVDTNTLIYSLKFKIDIAEELKKMFGRYNLIIIDKVLKELKNLTETGKGKDKKSAKMAIEYIKKKSLKVTQTKDVSSTDDYIVKLAIKKKAKVITQDRELKKRLKGKGINAISIRQKKYLK